MNRGVALVGVVLMTAAVLSAFAASAPPVQLWVVAPSGPSSTSIDDSSTSGVEAAHQERDDAPDHRPGLGPLVQVLAVIVFVAGAAATVSMRTWWPDRWPLRGDRSGRRLEVDPLPFVPDGAIGVDLERARTALSIGRPRNAIVACWMQLEHDIAAAGWPRRSEETSAEFVERIVADASFDPGAVTELAAMYREARFSDHALGDADRERALRVLAQIEAGLGSGRSMSS